MVLRSKVSDGVLKASVVVPTYNRRLLLRYTLLSLAKQTVPPDQFEVIVVDDGSSDDSVEEVEAVADVLNVRYFRQEDEGYRVALARNVGLRNARAPICVLLDSGVLMHSACLRAHIDAHAACPCSAVIGYVYGFNEDNESADQIAQAISPSDVDQTIVTFEALRSYLDIREGFYSKYGEDFTRLHAPWLMFWTCNASVPTLEARRAGLFDENFTSWGAEDVEFALRLDRCGVRARLARDARAVHFPHAKSYTDNMSSAISNYAYVHRKHGTRVTQLMSEGRHFHDIHDYLSDEAFAARPAVHAVKDAG